MYDIKKVITKIKYLMNIESNIDLAKRLNVSYNTLNTWIKRGKLPQEVLYNLASEYKASLDYLLFEDSEKINRANGNLLDESNSTDTNILSFTYYGTFDALNIKPGDILTLNSTLLHSGGYYILYKENIHIITESIFDIFNKRVTIKSYDKSTTIDINEFKRYNIGLIIES